MESNESERREFKQDSHIFSGGRGRRVTTKQGEGIKTIHKFTATEGECVKVSQGWRDTFERVVCTPDEKTQAARHGRRSRRRMRRGGGS